MTVKPLPSVARLESRPQSAFSFGMSFAVGFWLVSLFFVPPVVAVGLITYSILTGLF